MGDHGGPSLPAQHSEGKGLRLWEVSSESQPPSPLLTSVFLSDLSFLQRMPLGIYCMVRVLEMMMDE